MLLHSSVVVFLSDLYQLPEPSPPIIFSPSFCRNHNATCTTPERYFSEPVQFTRTLRLVGVANLPAYPSEPSRCVATKRRGLAASSPLPHLPGRRSMRPDLFGCAAWQRRLPGSSSRRTS